MATPSPVLPRGTRINVGSTGSIERILRGPAKLDDGTHNLLGCRLIDNNQTHTSRTLNLDLDENQTISAIFKRLSYQVNLTSTPLVGGSIFADIGSTVQAQNLIVGYGDEVKISALSTEAYQFEKWSGNGLSGYRH